VSCREIASHARRFHYFQAGEYQPAQHVPDRAVSLGLDDDVEVVWVSVWASSKRCSEAVADLGREEHARDRLDPILR